MVVGSSIACKGNGKTLGLTNGTQNAGVNASSQNWNLGNYQGAYGTNVGSTSLSGNSLGTKTVGITTDGTKSGIITDISGLPTLNWAIKF